MNIDDARRLAAAQLDKLAEALEGGRSEALTAFLAAMSRFHHYSASNLWLILAQRPDATHVAGFHTWKSLGRYVKAGEKGIAIFAPVLRQRRPKEPPPEEEPQEEEVVRRVLGFRLVYVFDIGQTEGAPLPEPCRVEGEPGFHTNRLKALIGAEGIELAYAEGMGAVLGCSSGGRITLKAGLPTAEEFSVLVHELAHEFLHQSDADKQPSKCVRETEAEAVAFVVTSAIGLETSTAAADYIQLYGGNKATLLASLERIQQTAARILDGLDQDTLPTNLPAAFVGEALTS